MGRRSRKGRPVAERPATEPPLRRAEPSPARAEPSLERGYARARERDAAARADLVPLGPGERPAALVIASVVAALLGVLNLVFLLAGVEVDGQQASTAGVIGLSALLLIAAAGIWTKRYWAVLGFEALLGITIAFAALSLLVASNAAAVVLCLAIIGLGGWLFWKLVRVMGRLQAPTRRPRNEVR